MSKRQLAIAVVLLCLALVGARMLRADSTPARTSEIWMGHQRALVVLLEWKNKPAQVSQEEVERTFFGTEAGDHSMKQFFQENSAGQMDITGTVLPWIHAPQKWTRWWCMTHDNISNFFDRIKGCAPKTVTDYAWSLVKDQVNIADYDSDGDGKIDLFFVVHSGRIWKQRGTPDDVFDYRMPQADEAAVFQSQGLGHTGTQVPIGFYLHESGHNHFLLGDYYGDGVGYQHGRYGIGMWGIMGLGAWGYSAQMPVEQLFRHPTHFEAASKVRIGWANAQVFTRGGAHIMVGPVERVGDVIVIPLGKQQGNSLFVEYRSARGLSADHPGHGLLIWKGWTLEQADGRDDLNHGHDLGKRPLPPNQENFADDSDPFPGSMGVTSWTDPDSGVSIQNIVIHKAGEGTEAGDDNGGGASAPHLDVEYATFDVVFPNSAVEAESEASLAASLRTLRPSFRPLTLNGQPWSDERSGRPELMTAPDPATVVGRFGDL
ncbi:MAG TPA: M6 family metalloprotease domain-containing protein [Bdellovibrionota bacterium]|jgi:M6 family metalloprotease-like protein|nr:M6 family metalloprotease domain-containing protein [Bdellovibrionota bacterium]